MCDKHAAIAVALAAFLCVLSLIASKVMAAKMNQLKLDPYAVGRLDDKAERASDNILDCDTYMPGCAVCATFSGADQLGTGHDVSLDIISNYAENLTPDPTTPTTLETQRICLSCRSGFSYMHESGPFACVPSNGHIVKGKHGIMNMSNEVHVFSTSQRERRRVIFNCETPGTTCANPDEQCWQPLESKFWACIIQIAQMRRLKTL